MDIAATGGPAYLHRYGLQWGHGFSAVDIEGDVTRAQCTVPLQWGHGFSAVDISLILLSLLLAAS